MNTLLVAAASSKILIGKFANHKAICTSTFLSLDTIYQVFRIFTCVLFFCEKAFDVKWTQHHDKFGYENWGYLRKELEPKMTLIKDGEKYFDECAYWVGFVYRYLYIETGIPSKKLKDIFPFAFIEKGFYAYCSEDIKVFINFICKKFNIKRIAYCD